MKTKALDQWPGARKAARGEALHGLPVALWLDTDTHCDWVSCDHRTAFNHRQRGMPAVQQSDRSWLYPWPHASIWFHAFQCYSRLKPGHAIKHLPFSLALAHHRREEAELHELAEQDLLHRV